MEETTLLFGGDFVITKDVNSNDILNNEIIQLFNDSDYNIINLEAPITTSSRTIIKTGPNLKANKQSTANILNALNINTVTLANNHILDFDAKGVRDTLDFCTELEINAIGAGMNLAEASKTYYETINELKIAFVNFAENEWASAKNNVPGANPMNIVENTRQIKDAKSKADFVFVIVHGGHEYFKLPSPRMQNQYRFYAEQGADIVIGHHTHCISGFEFYNGIPIYYSLGNFLFTSKSSYRDWYTGLILEIKIKNKKLIPKLHPIRQNDEDFSLKLLNDTEKEGVLKAVSKLNTIIGNKKKLNSEWEKFINTKYSSYLNYLSPLSFIPNHYIRGIMKKLGIRCITKKGLALNLNLIRCEAHSDVTSAVAEKYLKK